jgi:hypothetical protein
MLSAVPVSQAPPPRPLLDLSDVATRARLTPAALEGFVNLAGFWRLTSRQAAQLLGESERTWFRIKAGQWAGPLSQDALTRISALTGVYKGLHLLFSDPLADDWVRLPNQDPLFGGHAPLELMIAEGIPAMLETRASVDALRGGL